MTLPVRPSALLFFTLATLFPLPGEAQSGVCPASRRAYGNLEVRISEDCTVAAQSSDAMPPVPGERTERNYSINAEGFLLVFVDVGSTSDPQCTNSKCTGSRAYYAVPAQPKAPSAPQVQDLGEFVRVTSATGLRMDFSKQTAQPLPSSPDFELSVSPEISMKNQGGLEIQRFRRGLLIDGGWAAGRIAIERAIGTSRAVDPERRGCTVPNSVLIRPETDARPFGLKQPAFTELLQTVRRTKGCQNLAAPVAASTDATATEAGEAGEPAAAGAPAR